MNNDRALFETLLRVQRCLGVTLLNLSCGCQTANLAQLPMVRSTLELELLLHRLARVAMS